MSERVERLILESKLLMPPSFIINCGDDRIKAFLEMVVGDINLWLPVTDFSLDNCPARWETILKFGTQLFSLLFMQATYTLQDFGYSDGGLSITLDRVTKINQNYTNVLEMYKLMVINAKKAQMLAVGGKGIGSPRYQSQIGQFLKIALSGCLFNNSILKLIDGYKKIDEFRGGELVLTHKGNYKKVLAVTENISDNIYHLFLNNDKILHITENHLVYVKANNDFKWIRAKDLNDQMYATLTKNNNTELIGIKKLVKDKYSGKVFNLEVEDDNSYVAEGIAVHNSFTWNSP